MNQSLWPAEFFTLSNQRWLDQVISLPVFSQPGDLIIFIDYSKCYLLLKNKEGLVSLHHPNLVMTRRASGIIYGCEAEHS